MNDNKSLGSSQQGATPLAIYSPQAPAPQANQPVALQVDSAGNLLVNVAVGGGGGGSNASVGATGAAAPASATEIGSIDSNGKLQGASSTNPVPVTGTLSNNNAAPGSNHIGALTAVANAAAPSLTEGDETLLSVDLGGRVRTSAPSLVDANNSSTTPLGSNGVFTGTGTDLLSYKALSIAVFADQNSAANGMSVQFSEDNVHWDLTETFTVTASVALTNQFTIRARYFRIVYTNGGTAQGAFRLQALLHPAPLGVRLAPISQTVLAADEALTTHSVITGLNTGGGGSYVDVKVNPSGTLATQDGADATLGGTSAPSVVMVAGGKTNDATPQYQPVPEGPGGRSVIVEGVSGGVAVAENLSQISGSAVATAASGVQKVGIVGSTGTALDSTAGVLDENIKNVGGSAVSTAASGVQKVGVVGSTGTTFETTAGVLDHNLKNVNNAAVATAASGVQKVGVVGNAGATVDSTVGAGTAPTNQVVAGEIYNSSAPAPTTGQAMALQSDSSGSQFVNTSRRSNAVVQATTISSTGATTILAAGAASHFRDITDLIISVTPQATTASSFTATLSDGTNSYIFDLVAPVTTATPKNPFVINFRTPLKATSAATAWTLNLSATNTVHVTVVAVDQLAA